MKSALFALAMFCVTSNGQEPTDRVAQSSGGAEVQVTQQTRQQLPNASKVDFGYAYGEAIKINGGDVWSDNLKDENGKPLLVKSIEHGIEACEKLTPKASLPTQREFMDAEKIGVFKVLPNIPTDVYGPRGYMTTGSYNTRYFYDRFYAYRGKPDAQGNATEPEVWIAKGVVVFVPEHAESTGHVWPAGLKRQDQGSPHSPPSFLVRCIHRAPQNGQAADQRPKQEQPKDERDRAY